MDERMFLHLNQAGTARSGLVVSLSFYGILLFFMGYGHGGQGAPSCVHSPLV